MTRKRQWPYALLFLSPLVFSSEHALASDTKQRCVTAYEESQHLRQRGELIAAKKELLVCVQSACPIVLQRDCTQWLEEVNQSTPTMVIEAQAPDGSDLVKVQVFMDGHLVRTELDGKAIALDPGLHAFEFRAPDHKPIKMQVVAREAERNRWVVLHFESAFPPKLDPPKSPEKLAPPRANAPVPTATYVFGGLGIAGLSAFATIGLLGLSAKSDLDNQKCKPRCPQGDVDAVDQKFLIADIGLGIGLISIATSAAIYLFSRDNRPPQTANRPQLFWSAAPLKEGEATMTFPTSF